VCWNFFVITEEWRGRGGFSEKVEKIEIKTFKTTVGAGQNYPKTFELKINHSACFNSG